MMIVKLLVPGLSGVAIFAAQLLDEKTSVPLVTTVSVVLSMLAFTWATSSKLQKFIDRLQSVEKNAKPYDDTDLKASMSLMRGTVSMMKQEMADIKLALLGMPLDDSRSVKAEFALVKEEIADIKLTLTRLVSVRSSDTEMLRKQLQTTSMLESMSGPTGMRILIVDDDQNDAILMTHKLEPMFIVESALTMKDANVKLSSKPFDAVFLDLRLPDSRQNKTVADFVKIHPGMLCIVLSGMVDDDIRRLCFEQGADDVWAKGVDDLDLRVITRKLKEANWRRHRKK